MRRSVDTAPRPMVDWTARQIDDPILRLRFLRAVAPPAPTPKVEGKRRKTIGLIAMGLFVVVGPWGLRFVGAQEPPVSTVRAVTPVVPPPTPPPNRTSVVWQVEATEGHDTYSNGLRIDNQYAVPHRPRSYRAFPLADPELPGVSGTEPVGIVYHTTESLQAPFEPSHNTVLKRVAESLLEYVRRKRAYNFLIDRFGRVFRVVRESDAADHAGHSIWADDAHVYINLNDSFLGISFEAQTASPEINPAQVRSAAMLTEMLRDRYKIKAVNCVTHAQVSVNPANFQIGYHTDWASSFPFERLGLPDNYAQPLPSMTLFGFQYDSAFERRVGPGLSATARQSMSADPKPLRARYTRLSARLKHTLIAATE
jgi:N-acetylmuramoyl-L-alanine amidase